LSSSSSSGARHKKKAKAKQEVASVERDEKKKQPRLSLSSLLSDEVWLHACPCRILFSRAATHSQYRS
jgi:hypothetical protein